MPAPHCTRPHTEGVIHVQTWKTCVLPWPRLASSRSPLPGPSQAGPRNTTSRSPWTWDHRLGLHGFGPWTCHALRQIPRPRHGVRVTHPDMHDGGDPPSPPPLPSLSRCSLSLPCLSLALPTPCPFSSSHLISPLSAIASLLSVCLVFSLSPLRWGVFCAAAAHCLLNLFSFSVQMCGHAKAGWEGHVT